MEAHDMSNCNRSLSCRRWPSCGNTCGCVASDGTPACNPWAPWGRGAGDVSCSCGRCNAWGCNRWGCGSVAADSTCGTCGNSPCTCSQCGCGWWGQCGDWSNTSAACLTPRFVSIGRTFQRRITQTLCVDDIPDCAESPLTLVGVSVSGQAAWEQISECRQQLLRVTVPVAVQVRDCSGRCRTGHSTVTLTIPLCTGCAQQDLWRGQLYVAPCIRLAAPVTENDDGCFDATLEVQAEVFLVRMQLTDC